MDQRRGEAPTIEPSYIHTELTTAVPSLAHDLAVRTLNLPEIAVARHLTEQGYTILKRGWPDFLVFNETEVRLVEVKPGIASLKKQQVEVADVLHRFFGVQVEVIHPRWDS